MDLEICILIVTGDAITSRFRVADAAALHYALLELSGAPHRIWRGSSFSRGELAGGVAVVGGLATRASPRRRGRTSEDLSAPVLDDGVHQIDQVGRLIRFLVHLGEVLDGVVDEVLLLLRVSIAEVQAFQVPLDILLAVFVDVRLIEQAQSLHHDLKTLVEASVADVLESPRKGFKDLDCSFAGLALAQRDKNVVFEALEYANPL